MKKKLQIYMGLILIIMGFQIEAEMIEKIILEGNQRVSRDTVLFYMKSQEKNEYSEIVLKDDFKTLWETGFFENISIAANEGVSGKIVKIMVKENPIIEEVVYKTGKKIKENDIKDYIQKDNIILTKHVYFVPYKVKRAEKIIREMLIEKGYNQGSVNISQLKNQENPNKISIIIEVIPGPRTRIGEISFPGLNKAKVSPSYLIRGMKMNKPHNLFSLIGGKDIFNKDHIEEDLEAIKLKLQQKGYLEAKVGTPSITMVNKRNFLGKSQKMLHISIPISMGYQYRLGNIKVEGAKIIDAQKLKKRIKLKRGSIYNVEKRNKVIEDIQNIYGAMGYIFCQITPIENLEPQKKIADLVLKIHEGKMAVVGKLSFIGNHFTKDEVLRREWLLREGFRFNTHWLKSSILRMNQLGLVELANEPDFKPDPKNPQKIDLSVPVKEINRQNVNFNLGYSGYDGLFIALGYSTKNFMGAGETLSLNLQTGTKSKQYRLSFTEPYLFDIVNLGFSVNKTVVDYLNWFKRDGQGFSIFGSLRFARFFGASLSYSYEDVNTTDINEERLFQNPYYYRDGIISAISPTIYYSTVDSPIFPSRGTKILFNYRYSGGILGGNVNLHRTKLQLIKFFPIWKRHTLGVQFIYQGIYSFGEEPVPIYERFILGGEQSIRGFDYYTLGPRNEKGYVYGGNKSFQLNTEYTIPLSENLSLGLFYDIGNSYDFGEPLRLNNVYSSMGLEVKVFVPMFNLPFRLIFGYNPRRLNKDQSHFVFRFAVGPSFQL